MDDEKKESKKLEKAEHSEVRDLIEKMRSKGHSEKEIVDFLESLADKGKLEMEEDKDEDEKKVGDESQKEYDFHQDEKNYDEGKEVGEKDMEDWLGHSLH